MRFNIVYYTDKEGANYIPIMLHPSYNDEICLKLKYLKFNYAGNYEFEDERMVYEELTSSKTEKNMYLIKLLDIQSLGNLEGCVCLRTDRELSRMSENKIEMSTNVVKLLFL